MIERTVWEGENNITLDILVRDIFRTQLNTYSGTFFRK